MYPTLEEVRKIAASGDYRRIPVSRELYGDADPLNRRHSLHLPARRNQTAQER